MKTVTIYGASDDLIELEGDLDEEIGYDGDPVNLAFSDGTVLSVDYAHDGCWRIHALRKGTSSFLKEEAQGPDSDNYSDRVTLTGDIAWCVAGTIFRAVGK